MEDKRRQRLARMIEKEVKRQLSRHAMARGRDTYINKLEYRLGPALDHHLRIALATLNGLGGQAVVDWQNHKKKHLDLFESQELPWTTKQNFDRRIAAQEAASQMKTQVPSRLRTAVKKVLDTYGIQKLDQIPEGLDESFWAEVQKIVDRVYPPE